jgi:hypothetical protein
MVIGGRRVVATAVRITPSIGKSTPTAETETQNIYENYIA